MARRLLLLSIAALPLLGFYFVLMQRTKSILPLRLAPEPSRFMIESLGDTAVLLDNMKGNAWILQYSLENKKPMWCLLPAIARNGTTTDWNSVSQEGKSRGSARPPRTSVRSFLEGEGYTRIELKRMVSGYLRVAARINSIDVSLVLDTGASDTRLDPKRMQLLDVSWLANRLGPRTKNSVGSVARGTLGSVELGGFRTRELRIGDCDLSELNRRLTEYYGIPPVDGLLGADVLEAHLAVVDSKGCELYLLGRGD